MHADRIIDRGQPEVLNHSNFILVQLILLEVIAPVGTLPFLSSSLKMIALIERVSGSHNDGSGDCVDRCDPLCFCDLICESIWSELWL